MADIGILKTIGFTTKKLQKIQMSLFLNPVFTGMATGVLAAIPVSSAVSHMTTGTTGMRIPAGRLRVSFALRFGIVSSSGALVGLIFSALLTNVLVDALLRSFGISNFSSHPAAENILLPVLAVTGAFILLFYCQLFSDYANCMD